ncbi:MAG: glycoside hydrolase family 5 protein [Candidatus Bathyarchaeota archaeon]|nr:glycoside hydrolase family 5 protein [Candidatus Bathyarchaeota archaeon]
MNNKGYRKPLTYKSQISKLGMKELRNAKFYAILLVSVMLTGAFSLSPALSALINSVVMRSSGAIATISSLHTEGRYIKDIFNNTVILRGINHAGFTDSPGGWWTTLDGWYPDEIREHVASMKEWGVNTVRFHTNIEWWIEDEVTFRGVYYPSYRQNIKDTIEIFSEAGIYVIFEGYSVLEYNPQTHMPFPPYLSPEEETIIPSQQAFVDWWVSVATELKDYPNVIFELWNEPVGDATAKEAWFDVVERCITAIREVTDKIIIVQWGYGSWVNISVPESTRGDISWVNDPRVQGTNILYSTHIYEDSVHRSEPEWQLCHTYDDLKAGFQYIQMEEMVTQWNKPLLIGEIGCVIDEGETGLARFNNSLTIFNEWELSYLAWWWRPDGKYRLLDSRTTRSPNAAGDILIASIARVP